MAEVFASPDYVTTLEMPGLNIEIYAQPQLLERIKSLEEPLQSVGSQFMAVAKDDKLFDPLGLEPDFQPIEVELNWICNDLMQNLNREYRQKDSATDVLTFPLISEPGANSPWRHLPSIQLGSIFISMEWAEAETGKDPALKLERYLLERFVHGMLHLLGHHHDTMPAYKKVVGIQDRVLHKALGT